MNDWPRSPLIGHNGGPSLVPGWQRYCWKQARKALVGERLPIETVRYRIRRARQLGLEYPRYASILTANGRDIVAFLFTVDGLQLRLRRTLEMPEPVQEKLSELQNCALMAFTPAGEEPALFRTDLARASRTPVDTYAREPDLTAAWSDARRMVRAAIGPKLSSDSVVLIGTRTAERAWADAGGLAAYIPSRQYFPAGHDGA